MGGGQREGRMIGEEVLLRFVVVVVVVVVIALPIAVI